MELTATPANLVNQVQQGHALDQSRSVAVFALWEWDEHKQYFECFYIPIFTLSVELYIDSI